VIDLNSRFDDSFCSIKAEVIYPSVVARPTGAIPKLTMIRRHGDIADWSECLLCGVNPWRSNTVDFD
jgi:hypothetical protein